MTKTQEVSFASILLGMDASAAIALTGVAAYTAAALAVVTILFLAKRLGELSE